MAVVCSPLPHTAFTMLRNCWLRDPRISYKAKGLLGYLRSHAEGYRVSQAQIVRESRDARDSVVSGLRELQSAGYLARVPHRGPGRFAEDDYALMDPFDAAGNLIPTPPREIPIPFEANGGETLQSGFSVPGNPTREIPPIEDQRENTSVPSERARALRAVGEEDPEVAPAQVLAAEHYEATAKLGGSRAFLAARGIIAGALAAGHTPEQLRPALASLRTRGRPLTNSTLGPLLADPRLASTSNGNGGSTVYRDPPPSAYSGPF